MFSSVRVRSSAVLGLAIGLLTCPGWIGAADSNPPSVYAPPELPTEQEGTNQGALHLDFSISYFTDYVFRGIEQFEQPGAEDRLNMQIDAKAEFDTGKLPHPYVQLFANIADKDEVSNFQEIRPTVGFDWYLKPIIVSFGHTSYLYPERDERQTAEVFLRVGFDENVKVNGMHLPSPYALAAYDYDLYDGLYLEAGLKYIVPFEEQGLTLTFQGNVAYVNGYKAYVHDAGSAFEPGLYTTALTEGDSVSGLQRYEAGLIADYSLNHLFNLSNRYGEWSLRGYLYYVDNIDKQVRADTQLYGGAGIALRY